MKLLSVSLLGIGAWVVALSASAWTGPSAAAPAGNIPTPINVGSTAQTKTGPFILNNQMTVNYGGAGWAASITGNQNGILAQGSTYGIYGDGGAGTGVYGSAGAGGIGVFGTNSGSGRAVRGDSVNGTGVYGVGGQIGVRGDAGSASGYIGYNGWGFYTSNNVYANDYYVANRGTYASNIGTGIRFGGMFTRRSDGACDYGNPYASGNGCNCPSSAPNVRTGASNIDLYGDSTFFNTRYYTIYYCTG